MIFRSKEEQPYWLRLFIWVIKILVIFILLFLVFKWINSPVKGKIIKYETPIDSVVVENNKDEMYDGKYLSFTYPGSYLLSEEESVVSDGDKRVLYGTKINSSRIVMMTVPETAPSLDEIPSVKMRDIKTEIYEKSEVIIDGKNSLIYKNKNSFEYVAFCLFDGKIFTLAMTANTNDTTLVDEFNKMINSVKFK